jgi:hypothetical protein
MTVDPTKATDPAEIARLCHLMERLREMIDEGDVDERDGDRQYGQMARRLIGDVEYARLRKARRERAA